MSWWQPGGIPNEVVLRGDDGPLFWAGRVGSFDAWRTGRVAGGATIAVRSVRSGLPLPHPRTPSAPFGFRRAHLHAPPATRPVRHAASARVGASLGGAVCLGFVGWGIQVGRVCGVAPKGRAGGRSGHLGVGRGWCAWLSALFLLRCLYLWRCGGRSVRGGEGDTHWETCSEAGDGAARAGRRRWGCGRVSPVCSF